MAEKVFMIALSPTMEEGTILKWSKQEGEKVEESDVLCEVETDKASMEYESSQVGTLLKIVRGEGEGACVGDTIALIGEAGEDISALLSEVEAEAKKAAAGANETATSAGAAAAVAESAKAGGEEIATNTVTNNTAEQTSTAGSGTAGSGTVGSGKSSPLARKLAAQKGIDIALVAGTGPAGRVIKRDIENYTPSAASRLGTALVGSAGSIEMLPVEDTIIPVSGKRAVIARRLSESKFSAPHYYVKNTVAMDNLIAARNMLNKEARDKVSFNAFIMKFVAEALKRHPEINASWQETQILRYASIDIGLAVDLGNGLITPIVRNVGNKGVVQIDLELKELIEKTREGKLKPEEYTGATFSISNLGSFGVDEFTAIINPPGSAILALGRVNKVPVYNEAGNLEPVSQMVMSLSCDHRVIDGAAAGRFVHELQKMMQNPVRVIF